MNKKLFIVCPFANLEYLLRKNFGHEVFFVSAPAGMIPANDDLFLKNLKIAILSNAIDEVYIVNEVSNPLILSLFKEEEKIDISFLNLVSAIKEEFWLEKFAGLTQRQQTLKMAELLNEQSIEMLQSYLYANCAETEKSIALKGLVISKESGFIKELKKRNRYKIAYGL